MKKMLKELQAQTLLLYLDNGIVFLKDFKSEAEQLVKVSQRF